MTTLFSASSFVGDVIIEVEGQGPLLDLVAGIGPRVGGERAQIEILERRLEVHEEVVLEGVDLAGNLDGDVPADFSPGGPRRPVFSRSRSHLSPAPSVP